MHYKSKHFSSIKKFRKIVIRVFIGILLLILFLGVLLALPPVQTFVGKVVTKELKKSTEADININKVAISIFGGVKLRGVLIRDHHQDTLIYSKNIQTKILNAKKLIDGNLIFGDLKAENLTFYLTTYKDEKDSNINIFVEKFENENKPKSDKPFILKANNLQIANGRFKVEDQNKEVPVSVDFTKINTDLEDFSIVRDVITADFNFFSFQYHTGIFVENLTGKAKYSNNQIYLLDLEAQTKEQTYLKGNIILDYQQGGLANFTDKVVMNVDFENGSKLASNDVRFFYPELIENKIFDFRIKANGTLNNFLAKDLFLSDSEIVLNGDLAFENITVVQERGFTISGNITELNASNKSLKELLPNILGNKLPQELNQLGNVILTGDIRLTRTDLDLKSNIVTQIGNLTTDLKMQNISDSDKTSYQGSVTTQNFNLGRFLNNNSIGKITSNLNINGKGFTQNTVNTTLHGSVSSIYFNGYNYQKVLVSGEMKQPYFQGEVHIDDDNVKLSFDGLLDLASKTKHYDFEAQVDYADLNKLNLIGRDSISILKGNIVFKGEGNTIDDIKGDLNISDASYQNQNDIYFFEDFTITSKFDQDKVRTIAINSPDIIEGSVTGRFSYAELPQIFENALGSLYTNYSPHKIKEKQFLRFNFSIYNKIIEVFYPDISFGTNTLIRGNINPDEEMFKLNFATPNLEIGENTIHKIDFQIDTKNPLYNAYVEMDSISNKYYKISDFGMINVKNNDTLYFRTEFKGGDKEQDFYNLNLYYTIDKEQNSIVGFQKSELFFKENLWFLNEEDNHDSRVVFNKSVNDMSIDNFRLSHNNQFVQFGGIIRGKDYKDFDLNFRDVDLSKITPDIDKLYLEGLLNGNVHFMQNVDVFKPTSSLEVLNLAVNEVELGDLVVDIEGDDVLQKFGVNAYLYKNDEDILSVEGDLEIANKQTFANIDIRMNDFKLSPFSLFGGEIINNIRGYATGRTTVTGNLKDPEINGRLFLDKAGMNVVYLNTDFDFDDNTIVDLTSDNIFLRQINLTDTKYGTKGNLNGSISHKLFKDYALDLHLSSNRLLVLDTQDSEDSMYYGTAFIKGNATIKGLASGLIITANATSEKGTSIKIPIGDSKSAGEVSHIKFLSPDEKYSEQETVQTNFVTTGLELKLNLNVTPDAEIDIIIDRDTGHAIRGGRGNGILELDINTLGRFTMNGIFTVESGHYDFRYGGLISKRFDVKKGGTITWSGNPLLANMNIQGVYATEANPAVLLDNPSFNRKIPVDLIIDVRGTLEALQEPDFDITFPSVSSVLQSEIQYKLSDADTRRTQAFALLLSRNFLGGQGMGSGALAGSLTETASSLFNNLLSDEDSFFDIGVDYTVGNRNPNRDFDDSDRFNMTLSTEINEDITINGKLGVPVGGTRESVVVGNVEIMMRLNEERTLNARVFNRENDINYFGEGIGYTQGIGLTWEADFDSFSELMHKIFMNSRKRREQQEENQTINYDLDSDFNKEYRKFIEERGRQRQTSHEKEDDDFQRPPDPLELNP
ncbi:MAG: translocation/assembly module TamB domain-containing protein [Flavobacteriaceae bacterium]